MGGMNGSYHQCIRIYIRKINLITVIVNQLCKKNSLRSVIPFTKRMQHIGDTIKINNITNKFFGILITKIVLRF